MQRTAAIVQSSLKLALLELWKAKLRTFLSLFGITIGVFCIIGVLTTVDSLERNLQNEIRSLGTNTIYVDKWQYGGGADYPFWKYVKRPVPRYAEVAEIKDRTPSARYAAFKISSSGNVEAAGNVAPRVRLYGVTEDFTRIQPVSVRYGRALSGADYDRGLPRILIGHDLAERLFGSAAAAAGQRVVVKGQPCTVAGVLTRQGRQLIGGWGFDESVILPYRFARTLMDESKADPLILVQAAEGVGSKELRNELTGTLRALRRLRPQQDDDFALNDVNDFSETLSGVFVNINLGGWIIGALAFVVGIFGVANIMFVTVTERRPQIGLKKAIGAKRRSILLEFLLESAFLCLMGGAIGLLLVFVLTRVASALLQFPFFLSAPIIGLALLICIGAGIAAGLFPAARAAKMNPVVALRG